MTAAKRRTDACLRACEGISTKNLEDNVRVLELARRYNGVLRERDYLQAKIEAMERQYPYAFAVAFPESSRVELVHDLDDLCEDMTNEAHEVRKLYLAPGAQLAPSMPDLLEPLRCACNYIDKLGGVIQQYRAMLASLETKP